MINVLPPAVYNLLAAGEVVENPAAVVKECVENSLDAGATEIEVAIETGGLDLMRITDNGSGVVPDEIEKVFLPHATSKISSAGDLDAIGTLGFRGEALSSIAAVSRVEFTSCTQNKVGTFLRLEAGKIIEKKTAAANPSTTISISNLFYNTPILKPNFAQILLESAAAVLVAPSPSSPTGNLNPKVLPLSSTLRKIISPP